jgi:ornithine carbamoyltransferase
MLSGITARVGPHRDIEELAKWSTVPVLNALSDRYHPFQAVTDLLTIAENRPSGGPGLGLENTKIAWIGDPTNVLIDLAIGAMKLGIHLAVATPEEYRIPDAIRTIIQNAADSSPHPGTLRETIVRQIWLAVRRIVVACIFRKEKGRDKLIKSNQTNPGIF